MHANRDILLLLILQLMKFNSYERSELGLVEDFQTFVSQN